MYAPLLLTVLAGAALVHAAPKHPSASSSTACVCTATAISTATVYDATVTSHSTAHLTTTLAAQTTSLTLLTTVVDDVTTKVKVTTTSVETIVASASGFADIKARSPVAVDQENKKLCSCPTTTTISAVTTESATATTTKIVTKLTKIVPPPVTVTSVKVKDVTSVVATQTVYKTFTSLETVSPSLVFTQSTSMSKTLGTASSSSGTASGSSSIASSFPISSSSQTSTAPASTMTTFPNCGTIPEEFLLQWSVGSQTTYYADASGDELGFSADPEDTQTVFGYDAALGTLTSTTTADDYYYEAGLTIYAEHDPNTRDTSPYIFFVPIAGQGAPWVSFNIDDECRVTLANTTAQLVAQFIRPGATNGNIAISTSEGSVVGGQAMNLIAVPVPGAPVPSSTPPGVALLSTTSSVRISSSSFSITSSTSTATTTSSVPVQSSSSGTTSSSTAPQSAGVTSTAPTSTSTASANCETIPEDFRLQFQYKDGTTYYASTWAGFLGFTTNGTTFNYSTTYETLTVFNVPEDVYDIDDGYAEGVELYARPYSPGVGFSPLNDICEGCLIAFNISNNCEVRPADPKYWLMALMDDFAGAQGDPQLGFISVGGIQGQESGTNITLVAVPV